MATDIAARGIHVDDVALVIHADPPVEHKAYLHRSGRTARAGAAAPSSRLMTDAQVPDVRDLTRRAGIKPTVTKLGSGHPLLAEIAPGDRVLVKPSPAPSATAPTAVRPWGRRRNPRGSNGRGSNGRSARPRKQRPQQRPKLPPERWADQRSRGTAGSHPVAPLASRPVRVGAAVATQANGGGLLPRAGRTGRFVSAPMSLPCTPRQTW